MLRHPRRLAMVLIFLVLPACGPILDRRDEREGRLGRTFPHGRYERDFWGRMHLIPHYVSEPPRTPDRSEPPSSQELPPQPPGNVP